MEGVKKIDALDMPVEKEREYISKGPSCKPVTMVGPPQEWWGVYGKAKDNNNGGSDNATSSHNDFCISYKFYKPVPVFNHLLNSTDKNHLEDCP